MVMTMNNGAAATKRGTVMELDKGTAVVLTPDGQFLRIRASGVSVGEEITWADSDRIEIRGVSSARKRSRIYAAASAAALMLLFFTLWAMRPPAVVAYVSMDINPSLELGLDARQRVLELRAINANAEAVVQGIRYRGEPVEEVMREIGQNLASAHFLGRGNEEIVIASVRVRSVDEEWEREVTEKISQILQQSGSPDRAAEEAAVRIETVSLPPEIRKEAIEQGISTGKMAIWLAAEQSGRSLPLSEMQELSLESISSSIGGIKQVLEKNSIDQKSQDGWKKLLEEKKRKQAEPKKDGQDPKARKQDAKERKQDAKERQQNRKQEQEIRKLEREKQKQEQEERKKAEKDRKQEKSGKKREEDELKKEKENRKQEPQERLKEQEERKKDSRQRNQDKEEQKRENHQRKQENTGHGNVKSDAENKNGAKSVENQKNAGKPGGSESGGKRQDSKEQIQQNHSGKQKE
jgi:hypothetical protein